MSLDKYESVSENLRNDGWEKLQGLKAKSSGKILGLALKFFIRHPSPSPMRMNLEDFRREHPDFTVYSIANLKALRTQLKKKNVL